MASDIEEKLKELAGNVLKSMSEEELVQALQELDDKTLAKIFASMPEDAQKAIGEIE